MTNEELALRIQTGERELAGELWAQVERLLGMIVTRYMTRLGDLAAAAGVEREDLEQEAYFAMLGAVKAYDPAKGYAFNSYLAFQCRNRFFALLACAADANRSTSVPALTSRSARRGRRPHTGGHYPQRRRHGDRHSGTHLASATARRSGRRPLEDGRTRGRLHPPALP